MPSQELRKTQKEEPGAPPPAKVRGCPIRLLIVDDHPIVRFGLKALLDMQDDFEVVGAAGSGQEALSFLKKEPVDVILVDLRMQRMSGIEILKKIKEDTPQSRSIVLSSFEYDEEIYDAIKAGAQGYIHKESRSEDILNAIRTVYGGERAFPRRIVERLSSNQLTAGLSPRERAILELVSRGFTNKEVAKTLKLSQFTIRNHMNRITEKLEVSDRTEAIFVAIQTGIIKVP